MLESDVVTDCVMPLQSKSTEQLIKQSEEDLLGMQGHVIPLPADMHFFTSR